MDESSINFELLFAGSAGADTASADGVEVAPHAYQARVGVLQLGQFDLEAGLMGLSPRSEDVQNEFTAVEDFQVNNLFQLSNLGRGKVVIENNCFGFILLGALGNHLGCPGADVAGGVNPPAFLSKMAHHAAAGCFSQPL